MITADQPAHLPSGVSVAVSSRTDGSMLDRTRGIHEADILDNRRRFCSESGIEYEDVVYQQIVYGDDQSYQTLVEVGPRDTSRYREAIRADGLFTRHAGVGLFLPVADCVATVLYDPTQRLLALLHLGRHSTLTSLLENTVERFKENGSHPSDIWVWMSPSAKYDTYKLEWFDSVDDPLWKGFCREENGGVYVDLPGYNRQRCLMLGVQPSHIEVSPVDTTTHPYYFSHRAGDRADRIAVLAMMR